jgi:DNA modification methylase
VTVYLDDPDFTLYCGDALETLRQLPDGSVHMCVTSPPFYGLRDYGVDRQIGLEETPEQWVTNLVNVFREVRRVLRADGTLWLEVGDSYAANTPGSLGGGSLTKGGQQHRANRGLTRRADVKHKDLVGAPWMLAFALRADGWWLRSDIIWARPNPMPESVTDRPTKSHSYVFLLAKSARYFYDADAVREDGAGRLDLGRMTRPEVRLGEGGPWANDNGYKSEPGRNVRSVWTIPTQPLAEPHYAAFPEELARRAILAGTSERGVCPECGAPWRRMVERQRTMNGEPVERGGWEQDEAGRLGPQGVGHWRFKTEASTLGWEPTCTGADGTHGCETLYPVPATVLDPFLGSGTTALVARKHGRQTIGIELNPAYCQIAQRRTRQLSLLGDAA